MCVASRTVPVTSRIRSAGRPATLRLGPPVHPDDAGAEWSALAVDGDAAVELAADAKRADRRGDCPAASKRAADGRRQRLLPQPRVLLRPARPRKRGLISAGRLAPQLQIVIGHHRLQALGADVDAHDHGASPTGGHHVAQLREQSPLARRERAVEHRRADREGVGARLCERGDARRLIDATCDDQRAVAASARRAARTRSSGSASLAR